jgi:hypothetical protein
LAAHCSGILLLSSVSTANHSRLNAFLLRQGDLSEESSQ